MTDSLPVDMNGLLDFRHRFDACLADVGLPPPGTMFLTAAGDLTIKDGPKTTEWLAASVQALRLTAPTFEPAARLLEATERELATARYMESEET